MRTNTQSNRARPQTHEGGVGIGFSSADQLRRAVMSCLLWENSYYEDGVSTATRIEEYATSLIQQGKAETVNVVAIEARDKQHLRHVPLLICSILADHPDALATGTLSWVIQRADELAEFLAIHAKRNNVEPEAIKPLLRPKIKRELAHAMQKFNAYQLAKYDRSGPIRLRDVLFLCHPKPKDDEQDAAWKKLITGTLPSPDTWEVGLSAGDDKKATFERLLRDGKLGYLALLRNLRNMVEADVDDGLIRDALLARKGAQRVLPFRYVAAARACPRLEPTIDAAMCAALLEKPKWPGRTIILIDVSGSMCYNLSGKSDMTRMDAACALGALIQAETKQVFSFSQDLVEVPPRNGMAMIDAIQQSQPNRGTFLGTAIQRINQMTHDRLVVITDEQTHEEVPGPACRNAWIVNIASYQTGTGTRGGWHRVNGWSESIIRYIEEVEGLETADEQ